MLGSSVGAIQAARNFVKMERRIAEPTVFPIKDGQVLLPPVPRSQFGTGDFCASGGDALAVGSRG